MELTLNKLSGVFTAIVTPFTKDASKVDYESLARLVHYQIQGGVSGIVVCGSTGEAATLSEDEYFEVVKTVVAQLRGKVPCIAGVSSSSTAKAAQTAKALDSSGVDGILLVCPPYNKPPQEGLLQHFSSVKQATRLPIVAYNVPGRTAVNLLPATLAKLAKDQTVLAVKESSGSMDQILDVISEVGTRIAVLSGDDSLALSAVCSGARGVVSVASNVAPALISEMIKAALENKIQIASTLQMRLLPLMRAMFCETNPIPVKCALALKGVIDYASVRLPLVNAQAATVEKIKNLIQQGGLE